jgi:hypothetical protein
MNALDEGIAFEQKDINPETDCNSFNVAFFFVIKDSNEDLNLSNCSGGIKILNISVSIKYPEFGSFVITLIQERAIKYRDPLFYS